MHPLARFCRLFLALPFLACSIHGASAQSTGQVEIAATQLPNSFPSDSRNGQAPLTQRREELAALAVARTKEGEAAVSAWMDRLLAGEIEKELQLEVVEAASKYDSAAIKEKLQTLRLNRLQQGSTSIELLYGGDTMNGRKVFLDELKAGCVKCHKVGDQGGEIGPPLNGVGARLSREDILESIVNPNAKITTGYETLLIVMKDRSGHGGIARRETETELVLDCPPDGLVTIKKADIASRRKGSSLMPDGFAQSLSPRDLRDLVEFLAELKK